MGRTIGNFLNELTDRGYVGVPKLGKVMERMRDLGAFEYDYQANERGVNRLKSDVLIKEGYFYEHLHEKNRKGGSGYVMPTIHITPKGEDWMLDLVLKRYFTMELSDEAHVSKGQTELFQEENNA